MSWSNVFLLVMLGISLYTNFDLLGKYEKCLGIDYSTPILEGIKFNPIQPVQASSRREYLESVADTVEELHKLPKGLVKSILYQESRYNANARGAAGEIGIAQIKPATLMKFCPQCVNGGNYFLVRGSKGDKVKTVQKALSRKNGLAIADITGVYDSATEESVRSFQKALKLRVDGVVGPSTWKALVGDDMPGSESVEQKLLDPVKSINYAAMYLVWLRNKLGTGDADILAAAYNGGDANMTVKYMLHIRQHREGKYNE